MKFCFAFILLCFQFSGLQAQWKKISSGTSQDLYDIQMIGQNGYIAGQNSTVLKSTDSGKNWKSVQLTIPCNLRALHFLDSSVGFVTGENARIQKTYNGGKTWVQKYVRTAAYAYAIKFSGNNGIAVGRDMLAVRSYDSGETWQVDTTFRSDKKLNSVCILPGGMCWAVGDSGYMIKKHLTQKKWTIVKYPGKIDLNYVSNFGDSVLIVAGGMPDSVQVGVHYNIFLKSTDSGKSWNSTNISEMKTINTGWFFTADTGFMGGSNGIISKCYQPFNIRSQQLSGTASSLHKMFFYSHIGYIVADGGTILRTTNYGGFGLGISSPEKNTVIQIYPNPSQGNMMITSEVKILSIQIDDAFGRRIMQLHGDHTETINIANKGIFFVTVHLVNGQVLRQKVLIN